MKYDPNILVLLRRLEEVGKLGYFVVKEVRLAPRRVAITIYHPDADTEEVLRFRTALEAAEHVKEYIL